ncbi:MAG: hypothetical protein JNM39_07880 [Bdellovibrionaceae bacterium]|nr:hypothetical protein [Pseudobdellovibrionaceae bacterium]
MMPRILRGYQIFKIIGFLMLLLGISGCYMSGSVTPLEPQSQIVSSSGIPSMEAVSGSTKSYEVTSLSGYIVKHSVGLMLDKQYSVTPNGYHAFTQINGRMTSDEVQE